MLSTSKKPLEPILLSDAYIASAFDSLANIPIAHRQKRVPQLQIAVKTSGDGMLQYSLMHTLGMGNVSWQAPQSEGLLPSFSWTIASKADIRTFCLRIESIVVLRARLARYLIEYVDTQNEIGEIQSKLSNKKTRTPELYTDLECALTDLQDIIRKIDAENKNDRYRGLHPSLLWGHYNVKVRGDQA